MTTLTDLNEKRCLQISRKGLLLFATNKHSINLYFAIYKHVVLWCNGYHYCTTSFNKAWTQVLRRFKSCSRRVGNLRWWRSLAMIPAGNKAKRLNVGQPFHENNSSSSSSIFTREYLCFLYRFWKSGKFNACFVFPKK